jgi:hypothetical protein
MSTLDAVTVINSLSTHTVTVMSQSVSQSVTAVAGSLANKVVP